MRMGVRTIGCFLASLVLVLIVAAVVPRRSPALGPALPRFTLIIVSGPSLDAAAGEWKRHRRALGGAVAQVSTLDDSGSLRSPEALREAIRAVVRSEREASASGFTAVLLLGDVDTIPTFHFDQPDPLLVEPLGPRFASDHPYQLLDDQDEVPDLALGRIPVSDSDAALGILDKIRRYESSPVGPWRSRLTFLAGEGRFGAADRVMEGLFRTMIDSMVPSRFDVSMTYANPRSAWCPPPSTLRDTFVGRFREGSLLVNYLGHGHATGLDAMRWNGTRILTMGGPDPARLDQPRDDLPIAFLGCCSVGWFDREGGEPCFAEALLSAPGGPVAIIAGSRKTHPYGTAVLQKNLVRGLLGRRPTQRPKTVGELDLAATRQMFQRDSEDFAIDLVARPIAMATRWPCSLDELRLMHVRLYNLLGDPCTIIAHPPVEPASLEVRSGTLHGVANAISDGSVEFVIECPRPESADGPLIGAGSNDSELERIAGANYPRANRRELARGSGPLRDGRFALPLPDPLPPGAAVIRVHIVADDGDLQWLGSIPLSGLPTPPESITSRPLTRAPVTRDPVTP